MAEHVLVTGGAGYVGSHACKALSAAGLVPVVLDNLSRGHAAAVKWGPLVRGDIADDELVTATCRKYDIHAALHFAAYAYVGESMQNPGLYYRNNLAGSLALLDALQRAGVETVVFSSTCATYGEPQALPISEENQQQPLNPYGETKLAIERALRWYDELAGMRSVSLRYFNAAGADPDGELGEDHEPETHLIPIAIQAALGQRERLDLFGTDYPTPDGTAIRDYIHVCDLADAHVRALEYLRRGGATAAVNLGTGKGHSVREIIRAVEETTGRTVPVRESPRRQGDPAALVAAPTRAGELLDWQPTQSSLRDIVETAHAWFARSHNRARAVG